VKNKKRKEKIVRASPTQLLIGESKIKKLYFNFFLLVFDAQREKPNKMINKISFLFHICYLYISFKKVKTNKVRLTKKK